MPTLRPLTTQQFWLSAVDGVVIYLTDYQRSITERLAKVGKMRLRAFPPPPHTTHTAGPTCPTRTHFAAAVAAAAGPFRRPEPG